MEFVSGFSNRKYQTVRYRRDCSGIAGYGNASELDGLLGGCYTIELVAQIWLQKSPNKRL